MTGHMMMRWAGRIRLLGSRKPEVQITSLQLRRIRDFRRIRPVAEGATIALLREGTFSNRVRIMGCDSLEFFCPNSGAGRRASFESGWHLFGFLRVGMVFGFDGGRPKATRLGCGRNPLSPRVDRERVLLQRMFRRQARSGLGELWIGQSS